LILQDTRKKAAPRQRAVFFYAIFFILVIQTHRGESLGSIEAGPFVNISGEVLAVEDVSAVAQVGSFLVIGSDEAVGTEGNKNYIQLLQKKGKGYAVHEDILLLQGDDEKGAELDIEGIAAAENDIYVIGAHCLKRKRVKDTRTQKRNRKKFHASKIEPESSRHWLYRVSVDSQGNALEKQRISLKEIIRKDPVLQPFSHIPSKENGIDIEGIAIKDGWLYAGFRGPVLRENYVPVMKFRFDDPENSSELLYVQLGGRGIRDITAVSDGFLLLSGSVGDGKESYQLYHWDGKDVVPGNDLKEGELGSLRCIGEIIPPQEGGNEKKVEGIAVLQEEKNRYNIVIAYDGAESNDTVLQYFRVICP
jgi:hypothetical protein